MKVLTIVEARLDDLRGSILRELYEELNKIVTDSNRYIDCEIMIVNPYDNRYVKATSMKLDEDGNALILTLNAEHRDVSASSLHTFDLLLILRHIYSLNTEARVK